MLKIYRGLTPRERTTFIIHMLASLLEGVMFGIWIIHDFYAAKTLKASALQITILVSLWPVSNFFSVYFSSKLNDRRRLKQMLFGAALLGRLPLALMALSQSIYCLLGFQALFAITFSIAKPAQNLILQANYGEGKRGELFGWASGLTLAIGGTTSVIVGFLLDADPSAMAWLFPIEAIIGAGNLLLLGLIPLAPAIHPPACQAYRGLLGAARQTLHVFRSDRKYLRFQANFMVYGFAFMIILPAIPLLATNTLKLTYTELTLARGILGQVLCMVFSPWFGRKMDRVRPARTATIIFIVLAFYALLLGLSPFLDFPSPVFWFCLGFAVYGVGMGGLYLIWHLGSISYAPPEMVATYQGIHISMTGIRGLMAPALGYFVLTFFGPTWPFFIAAILFLIASSLMRKLAKDEEQEPA